MKILSASDIKQADLYTIIHEPISSLDLMERAGINLFQTINDQFPSQSSFTIFCGAGNNGGDGLVIARYLTYLKKDVYIYILKGNYTEEFQSNFEKAKSLSIPYTIIEQASQISQIQIPPNTLIIDALFGIGISRPLEGLAALLIQHINSFTQNTKIAIDIPSGLSPDNNFPSTAINTFQADLSLTIQLPKKAFFFSENEAYVGNFQCIDIGLSQDFIASTDTKDYYIDENLISELLIPRSKFSHKGTFGHTLIVAGSEGKIGASILSSKAALKTGCGLLTTCIPHEAETAMHSSFPEAMIIPQERYFDKINLNTYQSIAFGPGINTSPKAKAMLIPLLNLYQGKTIIDADGLNILSQDKNLLRLIGRNTILTPHPGEFDRLTHPHKTGFERYQTQLQLSQACQTTIVLKGHHSSITTPDGNSYFNSTGNNGMATAGSGDVLTGIIASLCAQGYSPDNAAILGVYLHGFAGDQAAIKRSKTSLIASDIIDHIADFFLKMER